ncbi:unnamed protein product, partial [Allacma fusca]
KETNAVYQKSFEKFKDDIVVLKRVMDLYAEVAGIYLLAMLYHSAVNWFRFLNYLTNDNPVPFLVTSMTLNVFSLVSVGYMACFGNYLTKQFHKLKERLLAANVNERIPERAEISKLLTWIVTWDWKLSLWDMSDLNHATVPSVISAILPCMILIFELGMSKNGSK